MLVLALMFSGVQHVFASAKAGEVEVYEGKTATIYLADVYQRTLRCSKVLSYLWTSDNSSYVIVTSSTQNYARIRNKTNVFLQGILQVQLCYRWFLPYNGFLLYGRG